MGLHVPFQYNSRSSRGRIEKRCPILKSGLCMLLSILAVSSWPSRTKEHSDWRSMTAPGVLPQAPRPLRLSVKASYLDVIPRWEKELNHFSIYAPKSHFYYFKLFPRMSTEPRYQSGKCSTRNGLVGLMLDHIPLSSPLFNKCNVRIIHV